MIPFFEHKSDVYFLIGMIIIPVVANLAVAVAAPKRLWLAPVVISLLYLLETYIFFPEALTDFFWYFSDAARNNSGDDSGRGLPTALWLYLLLPLEVVSASVITNITYVIIKIKDKLKAAFVNELKQISEIK